MPLLLSNHYHLAKASLKRHRTRSFLTYLGVSVGIASITLIFALIGSIQRLISLESSSIRDSLIIVRPTTSYTKVESIIGELTESTSSPSPSLTLADVTALRTLENIQSVAPISTSVHTITSGEASVPSATILATSSDLKSIEDFSLSSGTFLSDSSPENAIVLGHSLAVSLFGNGEPVAKTLTILGQKFIIIGALAPVNDPINFNNIDLDHSAIVNADFFSTLNTTLNISQIDIRVAETSLIDSTADSISSALHDLKSGDANYSIFYGPTLTDSPSSLLSVISIALTIIACVSLVVGGISIMNIMLVSIAERTHEIGIKKSVGATNFNILSEYLLESIFISFRGGILGLILGYAIDFLISLITPFSVFISWQIILITLGTAILVGAIFGFFPALHAARKDPILSLKSYH